MQLPRLSVGLLPVLTGILLLLVSLVSASKGGETCQIWIVWEMVGDLTPNPEAIWVYAEDKHGNRLYGEDPLFTLEDIKEDQTEESFSWCFPSRIRRILFQFPQGRTLDVVIPTEYRFKDGSDRKYQFKLDLGKSKVKFDYYPQQHYQY